MTHIKHYLILFNASIFSMSCMPVTVLDLRVQGEQGWDDQPCWFTQHWFMGFGLVKPDNSQSNLKGWSPLCYSRAMGRKWKTDNEHRIITSRHAVNREEKDALVC